MVENFVAQPYPLWAVVVLAEDREDDSTVGRVIGWTHDRGSIHPVVHHQDIGCAAVADSIINFQLFDSEPEARESRIAHLCR